MAHPWHRIWIAARPEGVPDGELLGRFTSTRDEVALELVVRRHADLVWSVCRGVTNQQADAEDAFQATFLALARRAGTVRANCVAGWLQRVALHAALKVKARASREAPTEVLDPIDPRPTTDEDLQSALHEEIARLPETYRLPVLLCELGGQSHAEAAQQLGWPIGTLSGRLSRARVRLRDQLRRRGLSPVLIVGSLTASSATVRAAVAIAVGTGRGSASVLQLTTEVLQAMTIPSRWGLMLLSVTLLGTLSGGALLALNPSATPRVTVPSPSRPVLPETVPAVQAKAPRDAGPAERAQSQRNLRAVAQAIQAYHLDKGHLPTDILDPMTQQPLLSWRVAILPYMEQKNLHRQFKLDEPWDSAHNKPFGKVWVKVYAAALKADTELAMTHVKRFTGPGTLHQPGQKLDMTRVPDGRMMTLLVAEIGEAIPWTKPGDPVLTPKDAGTPIEPRHGIDWSGPYKNVVNVAFADGMALSLKPTLPAREVAALVYQADGMVVQCRSDYVATPNEAQDAEDFKTLMVTARTMTDRLIRLYEEEAKLRADLATRGQMPPDRSTPLADRLIELDAKLRELQGEVLSLQKQLELAKKKEK